MIVPPINVNKTGLSPANRKAHIGPKTDSDNIIIPTIADGVLRAPIVINIKPNPTWKKPAVKPKNISCEEIISFSDNKNPIKHELTPAINWAGTMSTVGNFLTIIIKTANVIGMLKAAKFPDISPGDKELPTINNTPVIAKIIEAKVIDEIVSFKNK